MARYPGPLIRKAFFCQRLHEEISEVVFLYRDFILSRVIAFRIVDDGAGRELIHLLQSDCVILVFQDVGNKWGKQARVCCLDPAIRIQSQ
ncbi:hypothetical protein SDC9_132951 [bioreactor metagenome]|uniref:Uncharacterized protein n=1 Tax=bioreactor metagenome TaxID=1076179 RepID=A0A645D9Z2_9ZZZZ